MAHPVFRVSCIFFLIINVLSVFYFSIVFLFSCRCAQCFRQFQDGIFYEFEGRKYCERDFHVLFAPCCNKCGDFVIGRVIKAMAASWHAHCFRCELCNKELADSGFIRYQNRALCHDCNANIKAVGLGKYICHKCHGVIDDGPLRFRGEVYHGYHFNCTSCGVELDSTAREVKSRPGFAANDMVIHKSPFEKKKNK